MKKMLKILEQLCVAVLPLQCSRYAHEGKVCVPEQVNKEDFLAAAVGALKAICRMTD